jgi:putative ABC transport system substrate-binding protein
MRRRDRIALLGGAVAAGPQAARAQRGSRMPRVGYLFSFVPAEGRHLWEACLAGLRDLGYVDGVNIRTEPRWAAGRHERLPDLVAELAGLKVDVIVAAATPASLAAKAGAGAIPIVIVAVADPIAVGLVESFSRPGGSVTGLSLLTPELSPKRVQLIAEILPQPRRIATLSNPDNPSHNRFLEETLTAARQIGIQVQALDARTPAEIDRAFEAATGDRADAMIVFDDPVIWSHRKRIVALAAQMQLPAMYGYSEFVTEGGLISYGPYRPDLYRRTAAYVDRILKGANPADLPIERPTKFELFVNLKAASALGLAIPPLVLARADEVIE